MNESFLWGLLGVTCAIAAYYLLGRLYFFLMECYVHYSFGKKTLLMNLAIKEAKEELETLKRNAEGDSK